MRVPPNLQKALDQTGLPPLFGRLDPAKECEGSRFHSPTPLLLHEVPIAPDGEGRTVLLCGTCADNLSVLQHLFRTYDGNLDWPLRREFGNVIRKLAQTGWADYLDRRGKKRS